MDLRCGDCLEEMTYLDDDSVDLLFADLPWEATSCAWDCELDLDKFWEQANRVCKKDAPMIFTCSVKFGNKLINSNPKNFRYDLVWVKSKKVGFLSAKKLPLRSHEMVYVFYRSCPSAYQEAITKYHKHKFLNEDKSNYKCESEIYEGKTLVRNPPKNRKSAIYEPSLPNSIIIAKNSATDTGLYGEEPNKIRYYNADGSVCKDLKYAKYEPPLPNSVIKEENCNYDVNKNVYGGGKEGRIKISKSKREHEVRYEPPLPHSLLAINSENGKHPTQKPVALLEWIIKYYTREDAVVLDPTMGSGTTGVACKSLNRNFIGIEKNETYYEVAFERLVD